MLALIVDIVKPKGKLKMQPFDVYEFKLFMVKSKIQSMKISLYTGEVYYIWLDGENNFKYEKGLRNELES